jgi:hypothetical protein
MRIASGLLAAVLLAGCYPYGYGPGYGRPGYGRPSYPGYGGNYWQLPPGPYRQSCRSIRIDGSLLKAVCPRVNGTWRDTALDLRGCDRNVVNDDGRLRCGGEGGPSNIPPGSYARSCTDIRVRNGVLRCDCRGVDGRWYRNEVSVRACRRFANRNGELVCE